MKAKHLYDLPDQFFMLCMAAFKGGGGEGEHFPPPRRALARPRLLEKIIEIS